MSDLTEARVREIAREEIRSAAQPESKPVAQSPDRPLVTEWRPRTMDGARRHFMQQGRERVAAVVRLSGDGWEWWVNDPAVVDCEVAGGRGLATESEARAEADKAMTGRYTLPPAPVQPVAPRELTIDSRSGAVWNPGNPLHSVECWEGSHGTCPSTMRAPDRSLVACACSCHGGRPPAVPPPAPSATDLTARMAEALRAVQTVRRDGYTQKACDAIGLGYERRTHGIPTVGKAIAARVDAVLAEYDEQPAPSATVDEVIEAVAAVAARPEERWVNRLVNTDRLRAALSTLSPAQLRGMVDAIGGGK